MTDHFIYLLIYKLIRSFIDISSSLTQRKALEVSCGPLTHVSTSQGVIWSSQKLLLTSAVPSSSGQNFSGPSGCHSPQHSYADGPSSTSNGSGWHFPIALLPPSLWSLDAIRVVGWLLLCFFLSPPASCSLLLVLWSHTSHQELVLTYHLRGHRNPMYNPSPSH